MAAWTRAASSSWMSAWTMPVQQGLTAQRQMLDILAHSAQTIGLRFLLAPPWMGFHPWVRKEWHDMTAEKGKAIFDSMTGVATAAAWPWTPHSSAQMLSAMLRPYHVKTRKNSARLGGEAVARAMTGQVGSGSGRRGAGRRRP